MWLFCYWTYCLEIKRKRDVVFVSERFDCVWLNSIQLKSKQQNHYRNSNWLYCITVFVHCFEFVCKMPRQPVAKRVQVTTTPSWLECSDALVLAQHAALIRSDRLLPNRNLEFLFCNKQLARFTSFLQNLLRLRIV